MDRGEDSEASQNMGVEILDTNLSETSFTHGNKKKVM
jgi:hypothetical protein